MTDRLFLGFDTVNNYIDCWASWCGPCKKLFPELKEIYGKWHASGLEIVGVSFDQDTKKAEEAQKSLEIPWDLVIVPGDEETRKLWMEANRIDSLPRFLLVDQKGILQADWASPPWNLSERIAALLRKPPQ